MALCSGCCEADAKDSLEVAPRNNKPGVDSLGSALGGRVVTEAAVAAADPSLPAVVSNREFPIEPPPPQEAEPQEPIVPPQEPEPSKGSAKEFEEPIAMQAPEKAKPPDHGEVQVREGQRFQVQIPKGDRRMCVDINFHDQRTLLITKVNEGPIDDHNHRNPSLEVSPGDRIEAINGVEGDTQDMLNACKAATDLDMTLIRCTERTATFLRNSKPLGLICQQIDGMTLIVGKVEEGSLVGEHNRRFPEHDIRREDRIIGINGVRSDATKLSELFEGGEARLELTWRRIWPDGSVPH